MATVKDVLREAAAREPRSLPEATQLTDIRVWQDAEGWHAQRGLGSHAVPVGDGPFASEAEAVAHGITAIYDARHTLALNLELDLRRDLKGAPEPVVYYGKNNKK